MISRFDAAVCLVCREMEQGFCENMLYHMMYNMLNSLGAGRLKCTCSCLEQFLQCWLIFCHDQRSATNTEHHFFDVLHFQIPCLGKQTGNNLANMFSVLSAGTLAGACEVANNCIVSARRPSTYHRFRRNHRDC